MISCVPFSLPFHAAAIALCLVSLLFASTYERKHEVFVFLVLSYLIHFNFCHFFSLTCNFIISFSLQLRNILLCLCCTFPLSIHKLIDILRLLWIKTEWTWVWSISVVRSKIHQVYDMPIVIWLGHMVVLFSVFSRSLLTDLHRWFAQFTPVHTHQERAKGYPLPTYPHPH